MSEVACPYCPELHPRETTFCPNTGRRMHAVAATQPMTAHPEEPPQGYGAPHASHALSAADPVTGQGKPVGVILTEAFQLYQKHLVTLLLTCAILIVPVSIAKSAAMALILAPTAVVEVAANHAEELSRQTVQQMERQLEDAQRDPTKWGQDSAARQKQVAVLSQQWTTTGTAAVGGLMALLLGALGMLFGVAVMYGIAIPLTTGALTIVVADLATGGSAGPGKAYKILLSRLGKFLSAWIPAFFLVLIGLCLLIIPGLIVGFLFVFVAPVVLLENVGGIAALKRSVNLVKANVLQVAVVSIVFVGIRLVASLVAHIFIRSTAFFLDSLVQDLLLMLLLPVPIIGTVLLYLDIRRQADGLDAQGVRAGVDGLRPA